MRVDVVRGLAVVSALLLLPALPAAADTADDLATCTAFKEDDAYDPDIEDACDRYLDAEVGSKSDRAAAYFGRARVIAADEAYDESADDVGEAIKLRPTAELFLYRGKYLLFDHGYEAAIEALDEAIRRNAKDAQAYFFRGRAYHLLDEPEDAMDDFDRAIKLRPKYGEAYLWRGRLYAEYFAFDEALSDFDSVIRYSPSADAYYMRAALYYDEDRAEDALRDTEEALKLAPDHLETHRLRAECFTDLKNSEAALAEYTTVLRLKPSDHDALAERAAVHLSIGHPKEAIDDYTAAIALTSEIGRYYFGRGRAYRAAELYENSLVDLNVSIEQTPTAAIGYLELGRTYQVMGEAAKSEDAYRQALDLASKAIEASAYASNYSRRGEINFALRQYEDALADFDAAIGKTPNDAALYYKRAQVREMMGDLPASEADRATAIRIENGESVGNAPGADAGDDGSWGAQGPGTIQKLH